MPPAPGARGSARPCPAGGPGPPSRGGGRSSAKRCVGKCPGGEAAAPEKAAAPAGWGALAARLAESENVRFLMQEAETTLGKTLSPAMTSLLLTITDDYGLPVE